MALIPLDASKTQGARLMKVAAAVRFLKAEMPGLLSTVSLLDNDDANIIAEFCPDGSTAGVGDAINGLIYEFASKIGAISDADANRAFNGDEWLGM